MCAIASVASADGIISSTHHAAYGAAKAGVVVDLAHASLGVTQTAEGSIEELTLGTLETGIRAFHDDYGVDVFHDLRAGGGFPGRGGPGGPGGPPPGGRGGFADGIGTFIGMQAGYAGGWVDNLLMRFTEVIMTFPVLFVMISNHFPMTYGHAYGWLVLVALMAAYVPARRAASAPHAPGRPHHGRVRRCHDRGVRRASLRRREGHHHLAAVLPVERQADRPPGVVGDL